MRIKDILECDLEAEVQVATKVSELANSINQDSYVAKRIGTMLKSLERAYQFRPGKVRESKESMYPRNAEFYLMNRFEGISKAEIARRFDISSTTVGTQIDKIDRCIRYFHQRGVVPERVSVLMQVAKNRGIDPLAILK